MKFKIFTIILAIFITTTVFASDLLTSEKLWSLKRLNGVELSPDGKSLLLTIATPSIEANSFQTDIYLIPIEGGEMKRLTYEGKSNSSPCWSPDGKQIGFISDRDGTLQAYIMPLNGGDPKKLTNLKNGVSLLSWSPDGKHLSFVSDVKMGQTINETNSDMPKAEVKIYTDLPVRHWDEWEDENYMHLFAIPAIGGDAIDLMKEDKFDTPLKPFGGASEISWSPSGTDIAYTCKKVENTEESTNSSIFTVPVFGGKAIEITKGNVNEPMLGFDMDPLYSPNGSYIAFRSQSKPGFESDKIRLMTYALKTGRVNDLSKKFDDWVDNMVWSPDSRFIYFSAVKNGMSQIFKMDANSGEINEVLKGGFNYGDKYLSITPDGKTLIFSRRNFNMPEEICRMGLEGKDKSIIQISNINTDELKNIKQSKFEEKWITTRDGQKLHSWVVYPPDFDPGKKYPLITYCQGGPQQAVSLYWSYGWNFLLMASKGYIILAPNRRGCPGFGQAWVDAISQDWGGKAMNDLLDATDSMAKEPYVNSRKMAAIGGSAGGYTTFWMEGNHDKRFSAFVSHCGVFNIESKHGVTEEQWFPDWEFGGKFLSKEAKENYAKCSPHNFADKWDTPILIITGQKDYRVPYDQSLQAFTLAQNKGIPSELIFYPNEHHWVIHPQEQIIWYREFFKFLDKYCK